MEYPGHGTDEGVLDILSVSPESGQVCPLPVAVALARDVVCVAGLFSSAKCDYLSSLDFFRRDGLGVFFAGVLQDLAVCFNLCWLWSDSWEWRSNHAVLARCYVWHTAL
mmetsp:Transcript_3530/g.5164  ORF Transcript_3530/g.5164 Transcript_3530/m.5164 type:complete len:109 (-) Transcript_3530:317-643(-)